jgi:1,2-diacylglycerol 3-beta-galactosyltransferase
MTMSNLRPGRTLAGLLLACLALGAAGASKASAAMVPTSTQPVRLRWDHLRSALRRDVAKLPMPSLRRERKRNVLILMSDTGGGHRASAQALKAAMEELHPGRLNVTIVDMYASCAAVPWRWLPQMYRNMAKRPLQWRLTVHLFADFKPVRWMCEWWIQYSTASGLRQCLEAYEPEVVVSMHAMTSIYPMHILRRLGGGRRRIPVVTVVTDLTTVHPAWFDKGVDLCFVASEEAAALARAKGLKQSQLRMYGLPIHPMFGRKPLGKATLRRRIGALPAKPLVLLVGGGDGVGGLGRLADVVAQELAAAFPGETQLMVVCGKNERVRAARRGGGAGLGEARCEANARACRPCRMTQGAQRG